MSIGSNAPALIVATMAVVTALLRFLPFIIFRKETPAYISYLGKVLPPAMIGLLVVYCLKDVTLAAPPYALPELISLAVVGCAQVWKRNTILSILAGTIVYMILTQLVFA